MSDLSQTFDIEKVIEQTTEEYLAQVKREKFAWALKRIQDDGTQSAKCMAARVEATKRRLNGK